MDQGQKITLAEMESKLQNDNNGSYYEINWHTINQ